MATIRLIPSTYYLSNSSYLSVSSANNMYANTDSTNYATIQNTRTSTSSYYIYLRGFNFDDVPSDAIVSDITIKLKAYHSGGNTSTIYCYDGTTQVSSAGSTTALTTSATTKTFTNTTIDWDTLKGYGSDFGIRINCRRSSRNTTSYIYIYGAEIEVTYTIPTPRIITTSLVGDGTIDPSGTQTMYDGDEYNLTIEPTNSSDTVTATKNGTSITLTQHQGGASEESNVLGTYTLVSGSFNGSGASYFQGLVGKGYDNTQTTSNYYSSGSSTIAVWTYDVPFEGIPEDATINSLYMRVNGHAESTSQSNEYMCVRLISGSTNLSDELNFKSIGTSNSTQTVTANVTPTVTQLENLKVQCRLGYYGGAINGATVYLEYEVAGVYYTYSTTISGDMTIAVTIGSVSPISVTGVTVSPTTASLEIGDTQQLTATVSPSNATDKTVSWSSNNTSVATVSSTGLVTAISSGNATITVTTTDGHKTAICAVTVATAITYTYKLASTMVVGKKYLIANGNTGSVYLLTNESGGSRQLVGMSTTISNGKITLTSAQKAKAEFECVQYTTGNEVTNTLQSDGKYLYTDSSSGLRMQSTSSLNRFWHYNSNGNKFWQFKSTTTDGWTDTSSEYKYYLEMTGSNFTDNHLTSPSVEDTTLPAIYLFVEDDGSTEPVIYIKNNGTWTQFSKVYKKVNGSWVEQDSSTWSTLFNTTTNYIHG